MSKASVVIPCFNLGTYLPEAIESVRSQVMPAREIIVVDDGSTDEETLDILDSYRRDGLAIIRTENNGASAARNVGVAHTTSEYVLCLDADDIVLPTFLEETTKCLDGHSEAGICATHVEFFGLMEGTWQPRAFSPTRMLWQNCLPSASLFRRECWAQVGGYRDLPACQDWDFWLSITRRGWRWEVVPRTLYRYRQREGSISEYRETNREAIMRALLENHVEAYQQEWLDLFIEMDSEIQRLRRRLRSSKGNGSASAESPRERDRRAQVRRVREVIESVLPPHAVVAVAARGDDDLLELGDREGWHFPQDARGVYAGHHPADSAEAIAHLEELRSRGAEFFVLPYSTIWWLDYYEGFSNHLASYYSLVHHEGSSCAIFDITNYHSFTVAVCTYNRAHLLEESVRSVFTQDYPRDRLELVVVDNASPDATQDVLHRLAVDASIPFRTETEVQNGLSFARNRAVRLARNEFVAFLDDDAVANPHWIRSLNSVVNTHQALVVGGRVEKRFEPGYEPPAWFDSQYVKHFFGVNYRDRKFKEKVLQIRPPLYLTGANIAYARRLFDHFGAFPTNLGRNAKSLLAGEETFYNLLLDRHDIPIFYSDAAYIEHHVEPFRLEKRHLRTKARWSGRSNAVMWEMFFGIGEVRRRRRESLKEIRRLARWYLRERRDPGSFARLCRMVYHLAYLRQATLLSLSSRVGRRPPASVDREVTWGVDQWLEEVERWPDAPERWEVLSELLSAAGRWDEAAAARDRAAERRVQAGDSEDSERWERLVGPARRFAYERLVKGIRQVVEARVPAGATVAVVSRGDPELVTFAGRTGWHFPSDGAGEYAGYYPADDRAAIAAVEDAVRRGAGYLVVPATSLWWLDHYPELAAWLSEPCSRVSADDGLCKLYRIDGGPEPGGGRTIS